jgi:signal transduction histidine kinase
LLGLFVYYGKKESEISKAFMLMTISAMIWVFANFFTDVSDQVHYIKLWSKLSMIGPIFFGYYFYVFSLFFPKEKKHRRSVIHERILISIIFLFLVLIPSNLNIKSVYIAANGIREISPGPLYIFALIFFTYLFIIGIRNILSGYVNYGSLEKLQVQYVLVGIITSVSLGIFTNVILPLFNYSNFVNLGPYFLIIFISFTSFAVIKYKLFNIKIVATQLIVYLLWIFILVRLLISDELQDKIINGGLLAILIIIGIFLIRSVIREVQQREKIELLAADLEKANTRLVQLDKQKSEFVSFATHQLRAPLTAMKGYASLILEGEMGVIQPETREAVERMFESSNTLASIVDDYLNITRIELGTMKYAFETISFKALVEDVIAEIKPNIDKIKTVKFSFTIDAGGHDYRITADRDKLKQVITNLIDNSLKYTPKGTIHASLSFDRSRHVYIFKVTDTGIGIAPEVLPFLFNKFTRAGNANKTNIKGTGLGLFVAKEMVTAHQGTIRAESAGEGKGSSFIVELEPFSRI